MNKLDKSKIYKLDQSQYQFMFFKGHEFLLLEQLNERVWRVLDLNTNDKELFNIKTLIESENSNYTILQLIYSNEDQCAEHI